MDNSIILHVFGDNLDKLKSSVQSIIGNSIFYDNTELILSLDGCSKELQEYSFELFQEKYYIKLVENSDFFGYGNSMNEGSKVASGKFLIMMNMNSEILEWGHDNEWMNMLLNPFNEIEDCGLTGPIVSDEHEINRSFLNGALLCTRKSIFNKVFGFDPVFYSGYYDADFSWKIGNFGYNIYSVPGNEEVSYTRKERPLYYPILSNDLSYGLDEKEHERCERLLLQRYTSPIAYNIRYGKLR